jgi:hypothetical protein
MILEILNWNHVDDVDKNNDEEEDEKLRQVLRIIEKETKKEFDSMKSDSKYHDDNGIYR